MHSSEVHVPAVKPVSQVALGLVAAIVVCLVVNTGVALATRALVPNGTQTGLVLIAYGPLTALGVLAGAAGWAAVRHRATRPRAVLRVLVPAVVLVSLVPGAVLLMAGNSPVNVAGLWVMHLVVAAVTVTVLGRVLPLRSASPVHGDVPVT